MRRVVITGDGYWSHPSETTPQEVPLRSSMRRIPAITPRDKLPTRFSLPCAGRPHLDPSGVSRIASDALPRDGAAWNHVAMERAIQMPVLEPAEVSNVRNRIIKVSAPVGCPIVEAADNHRSKGPKRF